MKNDLFKLIKETVKVVFDDAREAEKIPKSINFKGNWIDADEKHIEDQIKLAACLYDLSYEELIKKLKKSKTVSLTKKVWGQLENTFSYNIGTVEKAKEIANDYGYHYNHAMFGYMNDREMVKPIIIYKKGMKPYVVSGESELLFASAFKITPKISIIILE